MKNTEPCPTCKGWCCANHNEKFGPSIHYQHNGTKLHFCPDCEEGLACTAYVEPAPKLPPRSPEEERAAVVAWLREEAEAAAQTFTLQAGEWANRIDGLADDIERGEHRRGEER